MSLFRGQLWTELWKLSARKRTYLGFGSFLLVELLMLCLFQLESVQNSIRQVLDHRGLSFDDYFSGPTLALFVLRHTILLVGALYVALIAGDIVAKEVEDGTMRMLLCRPVSRLRVLFLKFASCSLHTVVLTHFIGLSALAGGFVFEGAGGLFAFGPLEKVAAAHPIGSGVARYLLMLPLLSLSLLTINSLAFMFSCFQLKPAAATISALSVLFADALFRNLPFFESIAPYFVTAKMSAWMQLFQPQIPWARVVEDYVLLLSLSGSFFVIGCAYFEERDLKR